MGRAWETLALELGRHWGRSPGRRRWRGECVAGGSLKARGVGGKRTGADSRAHLFGEGSRVRRRRRVQAAAVGLRALAASAATDGGAAGRGAALGSRPPALRLRCAGRSPPGGGSARDERAAAGSGAVAGSVGERAWSHRLTWARRRPPAPSGIRSLWIPYGRHFELPMFAMLPFGDKTR